MAIIESWKIICCLLNTNILKDARCNEWISKHFHNNEHNFIKDEKSYFTNNRSIKKVAVHFVCVWGGIDTMAWGNAGDFTFIIQIIQEKLLTLILKPHITKF